MRGLCSTFSVLFVLYFVLFASASPAGSSNGYSYSQPTPAERHFQSEKSSGLWQWLRDSIIKTIWGVPTIANKPSYLDRLSPSDSSAPSQLLARYGGDVVLRFNINSPDEINSLAEASNILFLDVWASTDEWVDIRIAKDVVSFKHWLLQLWSVIQLLT